MTPTFGGFAQRQVGLWVCLTLCFGVGATPTQNAPLSTLRLGHLEASHLRPADVDRNSPPQSHPAIPRPLISYRILKMTFHPSTHSPQTITFLSYLKFERNVHGPHLVVVPLSVLPSWMSEFKKWCPSFRVVRLHCNDVDERQRLRKEVGGSDVHLLLSVPGGVLSPISFL